MFKDLIQRMNRFVQDMVEPLVVLDSPMRRTGEVLLGEAESMFPGLNRQQQAILRQAIVHLRRILSRWTDRELEAQKDEIARLSKMYRYFAALPHKTQEQTAEMERLKARIDWLRQNLPERPRDLTVDRDIEHLPRELQEAGAFRRRMAATELVGYSSLTSAIAQTEKEIQKLKQYYSTLRAGQFELNGTQAIQQISALGSLIQKWNSQIEQLRLQETQARTSRWEQDKSAEESRGYVTRKEASLAKGKVQIEAIKSLREASEEMSSAFGICEMVVSKALEQEMPEAIPVDRVSEIIGRFEAILAGVEGILPEAEVRQATRNLDRLKAYRAQMEEHLRRLGYERDVDEDEARRSSEGLNYFRANVPAAVRDILSRITLSRLETLASTGINGAKEAITSAIFMAAKRNPERMKAVLRG